MCIVGICFFFAYATLAFKAGGRLFSCDAQLSYMCMFNVFNLQKELFCWHRLEAINCPTSKATYGCIEISHKRYL